MTSASTPTIQKPENCYGRRSCPRMATRIRSRTRVRTESSTWRLRRRKRWLRFGCRRNRGAAMELGPTPSRRALLRQAGVAALAGSPLLALAQSVATGGRLVRRDPGNSAPSLSRQFARWVAGLRYEDLPPAVVDRAKGVTLQALSSVLLGYR